MLAGQDQTAVERAARCTPENPMVGGRAEMLDTAWDENGERPFRIASHFTLETIVGNRS